MDFDFSSEQKAFQLEVRKALSDVCPLNETRRVLEGPDTYSRPAWRTLCDLGATAASVPEAYGGLGLGHYELCLVAEEVGRALAPVPLGSSIYLGVEALIALGSEIQKQRWLPKLASGAAIACFADGDWRGRGLSVSDGRLDGVCSPVADANAADIAVIIVSATDGEQAVLVELDQPGVSRRRLASVDPSKDVGELTFEGAIMEPLEAARSIAPTVQRVRQRAAILTAFEQIGGAGKALDLARQYAMTRTTFGRPIGSYQGIKHKLANVYIKLELARAHAHYGAWALSTNAVDLAAAAASARVTATDAFCFAAQENLQTHGGIGFTWEADCQLFYRRARLLALQLGDAITWKDLLVTELERQC